jgi:putative tributyrin esterase
MCMRRAVVLVSLLSMSISCARQTTPSAADHPRLTPNVTFRDVTFRSSSLNRDITYRVILPAHIDATHKLPTVYLLHGGGADYRSWSNDSDVSQFAGRKLVLVMPEGDSSYYVNAARRPDDRFEDYIANDLIADVEARFPASPLRNDRAVVGVSMGGFGAITLALKHPDLFGFVAALSPALDVPTRVFSIKRWSQWRAHRAIFGPWNGGHQRENDPFSLARSADPAATPYFFITCGEQEGLLPANRRFADLMAERHFGYEFHIVPGGHNWEQWNTRLPDVFARWHPK